jgi:WD40 repeat protein
MTEKDPEAPGPDDRRGPSGTPEPTVAFVTPTAVGPVMPPTEAGLTAADGPPSRDDETVAHESRDGGAPGRGDAAGGPHPVPGYEILGELGRGGMGVVYRARQVRLNRTVALKMILAGGHAGPAALARFRTEAEAVAQLQHPNIVQIYDVGEAGGLPYFSLEYAEGGGLDRRLDGTPLPPREAAALVETLARAVHEAHRKGVVHRDLKPANILLSAEGTPKITDFGLAKRLDSQDGQTQTGAVLGSPSYMAPEQAAGKAREVGPAADVYALGAILYELLTGRPPFRAATPLETVMQVVSADPVPPGRLQPGLPRDLETVCLKCLGKEPSRRYGSAEALADDLGRFLAGEPIAARPVGAWGRAVKWARRRPAVAAMLGLLAVVTGLGFAGVVSQWRRAERHRARATYQAERAERQKDRAEYQKERAEQARATAEARLYAASVALAHREWLAGNLARARQLLEQCPTRHRLWEWAYLDGLCRTDRMTLRGHPSWVTRAAFRPGGGQIVSAGEGGSVRVWDADTGALLKEVEARGIALALSPDGRLAATGRGPEVLVWDLDKGGPPLTLRGTGEGAVFPGGFQSDAAFRPDGRRLAAGGLDKAVHVWDLDTGKELHRLRGHADVALCVAYSPDGKLIASSGSLVSVELSESDGALAGTSGAVRLWDAETGGLVRAWGVPRAGVRRLAFSPDGTRLATAGLDDVVRVWDPADGREVAALRGHKGFILGVSFSPDGRMLASACRDGSVKLWDLPGAREVTTLRGHEQYAFDAAFRGDGRRLVTASMDGTVKVWDVPGAEGGESGQGFVTLRANGAMVQSVAFSPDGARVATGGWDGAVRVWDAAAGRPLQTLPGQGVAVSTVEFSRDGSRIVSAGGGALGTKPGNVRVWDVAAGREVVTVPGGPGPVSAARFSPDGTRVAAAVGAIVAPRPGGASVLDAVTGREVARVPGQPLAVLGLAFAPGGGQFVTAGFDPGLRFWDAATGRPAREPIGPGAPYRCLAFSRDGLLVAAGGLDASVRVWDAATGRQLRDLRGHSQGVLGLAFDPTGRRLASAGADAAVRVWDLEHGQELLTFRHHDHDVYGVAFDPGGRVLATCGFDGTVKLLGTRADPLPATDAWPLVFADDFDRAEPGGLWETTAGHWSIERGSLRGVLQKVPDDVNRATVVPKGFSAPSTLEIRFDCWTPDPVIVEAKLVDGASRQGLLAGLVGLARPGLNQGEKGAVLMEWSVRYVEIAGNPTFEFRPGTRYKVRVLREPRRLTLLVDGAVILSAPVPAVDAPELQLQGAWGEVGSVIYLDDVEVRAPTPRRAP